MPSLSFWRTPWKCCMARATDRIAARLVQFALLTRILLQICSNLNFAENSIPARCGCWLWPAVVPYVTMGDFAS